MKNYDSVFTGRNGKVTFVLNHGRVTLTFTLPGPLHSQQIRLTFHEDFIPRGMFARICTLCNKVGLSSGDTGLLLAEVQAAELAELYEADEAKALGNEIAAALRSLSVTLIRVTGDE